MLNLKFKKLRSKTGSMVKANKNFQALIYDADHYLTNQNLVMFLKNNKKTFNFQVVDKYVKLFEKIEIPNAETENIIPRRRSLRRLLKKNNFF